jgi:hypothetical protein
VAGDVCRWSTFGDHHGRRAREKKVLSLEEGWEVELWRSAYGVARFRLAQAAETPDLSADDAPETRDER